MKKSAWFCMIAFLVTCCSACEFLKEVAVTIGRDVARDAVNTKLAKDTTGTDSAAFELSYFPWFPAPGDNIQLRLRTDVEGPYTWDIGDGHTFISNSRIQTARFSKAGNYRVSVKGGTSPNTHTDIDYITVTERDTAR